MKDERKYKNNNPVANPITMRGASDLIRGKLVYDFHFVENDAGDIIGKAVMFYERDKPEEKARRWTLLILDDGSLLIAEW